jgi:shikimate kinase
LALPRNIILVGFMASGKSRVGRILARHTGWPLVDADEEIVRQCGKPIPRIFEEEGEEAFRAVERSVIADLCGGSGRIIAAGGGAFVDPDNRRRLLASGLVFCLGARAETIHRRLASPPAPSPSRMGRGLRGEALRELCRELRKRQTPAEEFFWELVRNRRFDGLKFRRQHPLGRFVADFHCPEHKLAIELDGSIHQRQSERDQARYEAINLYGIRVERIKNADILERPEEILEELRQSLTPGFATPSPSEMERGSGGEAAAGRPLLAGNNSLERIQALLAQRAEAYAQAHHTIETDLLTPEQVARGILDLCPGITDVGG